MLEEEGPQEGTDLTGADVGGSAEAAGSEQVDGGDAAKVAPEGSVGGPDDGGEVIAEDLAGEGAGAVGEGGVVDGEALFGGGRSGDEEYGAVAEAEEDDGALSG